MAYVFYDGLGRTASASVCFGMGCPKPKPKPKAPPPPKLEPQSCYSKSEHEALVDKCRGLAGFGDFTDAYYKAITKDFACKEAEKPICKKAPPKKPGLRMDLPAKPEPAPAKPPPKKPGLRSSASTASTSTSEPPPIPIYATAPVAEEEGISKTKIIVGVVGVAAVAGVLYMVFR
jgi:hypothetical protein